MCLPCTDSIPLFPPYGQSLILLCGLHIALARRIVLHVAHIFLCHGILLPDVTGLRLPYTVNELQPPLERKIGRCIIRAKAFQHRAYGGYCMISDRVARKDMRECRPKQMHNGEESVYRNKGKQCGKSVN